MVDQLVTNMSSISNAPQRTADIIGIIDVIAFQYNILALNAVVEAACTGKGYVALAI